MAAKDKLTEVTDPNEKAKLEAEPTTNVTLATTSGCIKIGGKWY